MPVVLILLMLAPLSFAADDGCTLGGIVVNSATREPVRRALVYARRIGPTGPQRALGASAATDAAGRFAFAGLEPGRYSISAERSGFVTSNYGARRPGRPPVPLELEPGHDIHDLILPIAPHAVIAGRVVDEEGEPVAGLQVQISTSSYQNGRKQLTRTTSATTNDLGEYRAYGLAPGKYYASVAGGSNLFASMTGQQQPDEDYVPVYYPRTTDPSAALPIVVTPGMVANGIDLRLVKARMVSVRGRLTGSGLAPGTPLSVILMSRGVGGTRVGAVATDGTFHVPGVAPGPYFLIASANVKARPVTTRVPLSVGSSSIEGVQAVVRAGTTVEGRVRCEGGDASAAAKAQVGLQPSDAGGVMFGVLGGVKTGEGGTFRLEDIGSELYTVRISGLPEGYYIASIRSGEVDVLTKGLDTSGGSVAPLDIVVRPNAGQLSGSATDTVSHHAVAGATVVLAPAGEARREQAAFYRSAAADGSGHFSLKNIVPGDYLLFAFEDIDYSAWLDPEYMKPFEARGEKVTVREGSRGSLEIAVIPAGDQ